MPMVCYAFAATSSCVFTLRDVLKIITIFDTSDMGKLKVVDDLLNGAFYLVWVFHMLDYFQVQTGLAVKVRCTLQLVVLILMSSR